MRLFNKTKKATFVERLNRFAILCILGNRKVTAFLPNPGRLQELLLPGANVFLEKTRSSNRKMLYTAVAVERDKKPVMLHTHRTNDVAGTLIEENLIPGLKNFRIIKKEITRNRSRFDFLLGKGSEKVYLEVKSCTLFGKEVAMFPDAVTARGKRHLQELAAIREKGIGGALLFIVHSMSPKYFLPEYHTDLEFSRAFLEARGRITIIPVGVCWEDDLSLGRKTRLLKIPWKLLEREAEDRGSYLVIIRLHGKVKISVGKLGSVEFEKGYYIYAGSARKHLSRRIERHRRSRKIHHWHIDYLRNKGEFIAALPVRTGDEIECLLARKVKNIAPREVPSFGSSDCSCTSHLFGMDHNPLHSPRFHDLLHHVRMERLIKIQNW